ncbi:hypothetical protein [Mucilaginibacter sp.]|uniref:hypothetical protein n=1 Tax=Mucilaginibacter sp. TaxID=1882438 RepID=UPI002629FC3C|nr:hypothetical protein [Mucilaginibacter sp.]MDB4920495.1 hypothetical protein [Mucilaginibacter sp.]
MKRFVKVILPPLIAFWAFAVFIKFTPFFHYVNGASQIGEDSVYGLISYYKVFAPGQILIAVLTQWLIIMPIWDKILAKPKAATLIFISIALVCLIFAFGIAYAIWDKTTGVTHLADICLFMTGVQLFYWIFNFLTLYLLDWKTFKKTISINKEEPANL